MVKRIMSLLFTTKILSEFSYNGRGNKKRCFEKLFINKIIFGKNSISQRVPCNELISYCNWFDCRICEKNSKF